MAQVTDEIKQRLDLVELIGEYVTLKPSGKYHKALCPIHHEKTPSFMVDRANGIWHCFGCGKGGDLFTFIQEMEGMDFPETLRLLAKKANVEIPRFDPKLQDQRTHLLDILATASRFYHQVLLRAKEAASARQYIEQRSITSEDIENFQIGFAPEGWENVKNALAKKNIKDLDMARAGLLQQKEGSARYYDRFRNRLMFPIADVHGNVIGFGGRVMPPAPEDAAKYVNSPQSDVYNKSTVLYGLHLAKQSIRSAGYAIVVEGYLDVIASHRVGVTQAIAASGTALTTDQLKLIRRFTDTLLIGFDTDMAGQSATRRGIELALQQEFTIKVISVPSGKDPDELIRQDPKAWPEAVAKAEPYLDYALRSTFAPLDLTKVDDKKKAVKNLLPLLTMVANPVEQSHYLSKLAQAVQVNEELLREQMQKGKTPRPKASTVNPAQVAQPRQGRHWQVSQLLAALLIHQLEFLDSLPADFQAELLHPPYHTLYKILRDQYTSNHSVSLDDLQREITRRAPELASEIPQLQLFAAQYFDGRQTGELSKELRTCAHFLLKRSIEQSIATVQAALRQAETEQNQEQVQHLLEQFSELSARRNALSE
ncbi:MAG: DNA primase [Candidatus Nomurabacteria bacterium]|nr:MAG: DNA primase [Candidatus Nomurabacteria bacterium]